MSLVRWSASPMMPRFSNLIDGFFNDSDFFSPTNGSEMFPATNIEETDHSYILKMAVPGLNKKDIRIEMDKNILMISAEQESEEEENEKNYTRKEYNFSSFKRSFYLPENVKGEEIEANCNKGELTIEIPKAELEISKPKAIPIG